jgi:hypothetical protein
MDKIYVIKVLDHLKDFDGDYKYAGIFKNAYINIDMALSKIKELEGKNSSNPLIEYKYEIIELEIEGEVNEYRINK